jgi:hypothetical protein
MPGCASTDHRAADDERPGATSGAAADADAPPPPAIAAWMDRLTVPHHYDPETGFIVADRVTALPSVFATGDAAARAIGDAAAQGVDIIAVATADRCGPCQQYKLDALNDPRVIERLERAAAAGRMIAVHIEVDRHPALAERVLGSRAIPMTYRVRDGAVIATLRGQRSADELLAFVDRSP